MTDSTHDTDDLQVVYKGQLYRRIAVEPYTRADGGTTHEGTAADFVVGWFDSVVIHRLVRFVDSFLPRYPPMADEQMQLFSKNVWRRQIREKIVAPDRGRRRIPQYAAPAQINQTGTEYECYA